MFVRVLHRLARAARPAHECERPQGVAGDRIDEEADDTGDHEDGNKQHSRRTTRERRGGRGAVDDGSRGDPAHRTGQREQRRIRPVVVERGVPHRDDERTQRAPARRIGRI